MRVIVCVSVYSHAIWLPSSKKYVWWFERAYTQLNFYHTTQFFQDDRELVRRSARAPLARYEPNHQWRNSPSPLCLVFIFTQHSVFSAVVSCQLRRRSLLSSTYVDCEEEQKHYKTIKCNVFFNILGKLLFWLATFLSGLSKTGLFLQ